MADLLRGEARRPDVDLLVTMSNVVEALLEGGFGVEYGDVCVDGREAILSIVHRATTHGRFTPTGPEITKLNTLMELHDAQMEVVTVRDMEKALLLVKSRLQSGKGVTKLPSVPKHLKGE